jgi:hypothetical protein
MKSDTPSDGTNSESSDATSERAFMRVAASSLILGFACLAGTMESLRSGTAGFYFTISTFTFVAAAMGAGFCLLCWKLMLIGRWPARIGAALLMVSGVGSFLYPIRFVRPEQRWQIAQGLAVAVCAISFGATLLWRLKRFFDRDDRKA